MKYSKIKTYVIRGSSLNKEEKILFASLVQRYRVEEQACAYFNIPKIDIKSQEGEKLLRSFLLKRYFNGQTEKRKVLELGFGMGDNTIHLASNNLDSIYFISEVFLKGIYKTLKRANSLDLDNICLLQGDGLEFIPRFPEQFFDQVLFLFPDPWMKTKHRKRRLLTSENLDTLARITKTDASIHIATDWQEYGQFILEQVKISHFWENSYALWAPRPDWRILTKYEKKALQENRNIFEIQLQRRKP